MNPLILSNRYLLSTFIYLHFKVLGQQTFNNIHIVSKHYPTTNNGQYNSRRVICSERYKKKPTFLIRILRKYLKKRLTLKRINKLIITSID
jgi:hypothetical protein